MHILTYDIYHYVHAKVVKCIPVFCIVALRMALSASKMVKEKD